MMKTISDGKNLNNKLRRKRRYFVVIKVLFIEHFPNKAYLFLF